MADRSRYSLLKLVAAIAGAVGLAAGHPCLAADSVRVATFNVSLYRQNSGEVLASLDSGSDRKAAILAEIIQRARPDVILLNEIDYDPDGAVLRLFCEKYLAVPQNNLNVPGPAPEAIKFPHHFTAPVNTGHPSGHDLDGSGAAVAEPGSQNYARDCWGFGLYPGQYAMAILSKHPIDEAGVRTFQNFRWVDMPGALIPDNPETPAAADWFPAAAMAEAPLSSKSHWDVPVLIEGKKIHLLASHPTPPVFDGPEDRNGRRNHDELRFWKDYVGPPEKSAYLYDDDGKHGGLTDVSRDAAAERGARDLQPSFIILGDLNGDPHDGDGPAGISALLASPRLLNYPPPESPGGAEQSKLQGGGNARHRGNPSHDTCDVTDDPAPGNLRLDYLLPSADLAVKASGVFWPASTDPLFPLVGVNPFPSSDHRLVWIDVEL